MSMDGLITLTSTADTQVEWLPRAYTRRRWYGRRTNRGIWFATRTGFQGAWGEGATIDAALDDLAETIRRMSAVSR